MRWEALTMYKTVIAITLTLLFITSAANSQSYSTLPPSVVGQPAVAIIQRGDNSAQVYQYGNPITMTPATPLPSLPSTNFIYDAGSGNSSLQFNSQGFGNSNLTVIYPLSE